MAPRKKISREETLLRKRLKERERYEKLKADPIQQQLLKEKERKKYENKKKKKQVKLVKDMTAREVRLKRKQWRKNSKAYYHKKSLPAVDLPESPPESDIELPLEAASVQKQSGRKRIHRDRSKIIQRNKKLMEENRKLLAAKEKYKKRFQRLLNKNKSNKEMTPRTKVHHLMKNPNRDTVTKRLLFSEALEAQMKTSLREMKDAKERQLTVSNLLGNKKILKKYKALKYVSNIIDYRAGRCSAKINYLKKRRQVAQQLQIRKDVRKFLENDEQSRMAPGKKDCVTRGKVKKQKRYLNETMKNLFNRFNAKNTYKISYSFFCKCRPFWVVYQKLQGRETCQCKKHANANYIVAALHQHKIVNKRTAKEIAEEMCCDSYSVNCLLRRCSNCSTKQVNFNQFEGNAKVKYFSWVVQSDKYKDRAGRVRKVKNTVKVRTQTTAIRLVRRLSTIMRSFMAHEAIIRNQYSALKYLKMNLNENEILMHIDFSENYCLKYGEEIQSFHFGGSRKQVTLHTCSLLYRDQLFQPLKVKSFCTLSKDLAHDAAAVFAHLIPIFKFVNNNKNKVEAIHMLSDSPSTQYRNKYIFYLFGNILKRYFPDLVLSTWNYLEAGHGKGMPDGIGGTTKRTADRLVQEGKDIDCFDTLVNGLKANLRNISTEIVTEKDIEQVRNSLQQCTDQIRPFKGSMQVHQVVNLNRNKDDSNEPKTLYMRSMSCFKCLKEKHVLTQNDDMDVICKHHYLGRHQIAPMLLPNDDSVELTEKQPKDTKIKSKKRKYNEQRMDKTTQLVKKIKKEPLSDNECSATTYNHQVYWKDIVPGDFVLVRCMCVGKTVSEYRYVCSVISKDEDDEDIKVQGYRLKSDDGKEFAINENDIFVTSIDCIIHKLEFPTIIYKNRVETYLFSTPLNVFEK